MDIIPLLQRKVNKIISDAGSDGSVSTSFIPVVYLFRSVSVRGLVDDVLLYISLLGVRGLSRNEDGIKALVGIVVWKVWLGWSRRYLFRRRVSDILRGASSKKRKDGVKLQDAKLIKQADVLSKQADNWDRCGEHTYDMTCLQCGHVHAVTFHCKSRVCPSCKSGRQLEVIEAYRDALMGLGQLRFITLTIKNVADLDAGIRKVRSCFKKLRLYDKQKDKGKRNPLGLSMSYKSKIKGGLYGIESPVGNDGLWNVHLHVLYAGSWIDQGKLADDWEEITGDSRVVWIEEVGRSQRDVADSVRYVVKYACKQNDVLLASDDKLEEYMCVLYKARLVQTFGLLLGKKADRPLFLCPECGGCVWRVTEVATGRVVYDERDGLYARASPVV